MTEPTTTKAAKQQPAQGDVWATAPDPADTPLFPFLDADQRADLVNSGATLNVIGMDYDAHGSFGARFVATFLAPDGNAYRYAFKTNRGATPRDKTNKWIWEQINKNKVTPVPVVLCKHGNSYFFAKPGTVSERDTSGRAPSAGEYDVPDF